MLKLTAVVVLGIFCTVRAEDSKPVKPAPAKSEEKPEADPESAKADSRDAVASIAPSKFQRLRDDLARLEAFRSNLIAARDSGDDPAAVDCPHSDGGFKTIHESAKNLPRYIWLIENRITKLKSKILAAQ